tara:strand:- start:1648 stop:1917 length:270 start_codon:yes stop_codon:yes gene_type:complete
MLVQKDVQKKPPLIGCQRIRQLFTKINLKRRDEMGSEKKKFNDHMIKETEKIPQHVLDDIRGDEIRMLRKEQAQREMYDDPYMNWSGLR